MESITNNKKFIKVSITLAVLLSLFVLAKFINEVRQSRYIGAGEMVNTISVSGKGEVTAIPDIAVLNVNLSKEAKTSKEAQDELNKLIESTMTYLKEQKIEDKDIKSEWGGVTPKYEFKRVNCFTYPCPEGKSTIIGYTANQSLNIKVRDVDNANEIRTGLTELGIENISGPTFSIDNEDNLKKEARDLAIADARAEAKNLAKSLNVRLGRVVSFSEEGGYFPMMYAKNSAMGMGGDMMVTEERAPELPKGENKINSNVTITYQIR